MQKMKVTHDSGSDANPTIDKLLAKLSEQSTAMNRQSEALKNSEESIAFARTMEFVSASSSLPITPATETKNNSTAPSTSPHSVAGEDSTGIESDEVLRLRRELEATKNKAARLEDALAQRNMTLPGGQAMGSSEADYPMNPEAVGLNPHMPQPINTLRPQIHRDNSWAAQDDSRSDTSDALSANDFNRRSIWGGGRPVFPGQASGPVPSFQPNEGMAPNPWVNRGFGQPFAEPQMPFPGPSMNHMNSLRGERMTPEPDFLMAPPAGRRPGPRGINRGSFPYASSSSSYDGYTPVSSSFNSVGGMNGGVAPMGGPMGMNQSMNGNGNMYGGYQPQPIGTPLSPHAPEFTSNSGYVSFYVINLLQCG
jgi:hypothetical protein